MTTGVPSTDHVYSPTHRLHKRCPAAGFRRVPGFVFGASKLVLKRNLAHSSGELARSKSGLTWDPRGQDEPSGSLQSPGMGVATGATDTWGGRPGMRVVKTTPSGLWSRSEARQASRSRRPPPTASTPAVTPG